MLSFSLALLFLITTRILISVLKHWRFCYPLLDLSGRVRDSPPRQWQSRSPSEEEAVLFLFLKDPTCAPLKHNSKASAKSNDRIDSKMVGQKNKRKENGVRDEMKLEKKMNASKA